MPGLSLIPTPLGLSGGESEGIDRDLGPKTLTLSQGTRASHLAPPMPSLLVQSAQVSVPPMSFSPTLCSRVLQCNPGGRRILSRRPGALPGFVTLAQQAGLSFPVEGSMGCVLCRAPSLACGLPSGEAPLSPSCSLATCKWTWTEVCPLPLGLRALPVLGPRPLLWITVPLPGSVHLTMAVSQGLGLSQHLLSEGLK